MQYFLFTLSEKHDRNMTKQKKFMCYIVHKVIRGDVNHLQVMSIFCLEIAGKMVLVWKRGSFINSKKKLNFLFI